MNITSLQIFERRLTKSPPRPQVKICSLISNVQLTQMDGVGDRSTQVVRFPNILITRRSTSILPKVSTSIASSGVKSTAK